MGFVCAFLPAVTRDTRGQPGFGDTRIERYIAGIWVVCGGCYVGVGTYLLNTWLLKASRNLFRFSAVSAIHNSLSGEAYGLTFHIPLETPTNLVAWTRLRSEVYRQVQSELNSVFAIESMLSAMIVCTLLLAIVMFIAVLEGQSVSAETVVGLLLLAILSVYTMLILVVTAYANILLNDSPMTILAAEKFVVTEQSWEYSDVSRVCKIVETDADRKKEANIYKFIGQYEFQTNKDTGALQMTIDGKNIDLKEDRNQMMIQQCLSSMELMLDATVERIKNSSDLGYYFTVFGIPVTFELLVTIGSALSTAIAAVIAQIGAQ